MPSPASSVLAVLKTPGGIILMSSSALLTVGLIVAIIVAIVRRAQCDKKKRGS